MKSKLCIHIPFLEHFPVTQKMVHEVFRDILSTINKL